LHATPYANQPLNDRGCTTAFPPLICTWRPYAGGRGSIYQVSVSPIRGRWYVNAVTIESWRRGDAACLDGNRWPGWDHQGLRPPAGGRRIATRQPSRALPPSCGVALRGGEKIAGAE